MLELGTVAPFTLVSSQEFIVQLSITPYQPVVWLLIARSLPLQR